VTLAQATDNNIDLALQSFPDPVTIGVPFRFIAFASQHSTFDPPTTRSV